MHWIRSALGRFVLRNRLRPELYDAGLEYGNLVRFYCGVKARHIDIRDRPSGAGGDVSPQKAKWLAKELVRLNTPLRKLDPVGFSAVRTLAAMECEIAHEAEPSAVIILCELGRLLRKVGRR